ALQRLRDQIGQPVFPVHRIDRPTSGVLLFALSATIARQLAGQFEARLVRKLYQAIVRGHPPASKLWNEPLVEKRDRIADKKATLDKPAQPAVTKLLTLRSWTVPFSTGKYPASRYSLINAMPMTGRKHQLRRHLNHMAFPILGDTTYGDRRHNRLFRETFGVDRLLLMAMQLKLSHPVTGTPVIIEAKEDADFRTAINELSKHDMNN
ncbi:UNVERIFIED_CONTAM: hypothetical protein GTU68_049597, partial [Idotea baltica]|nr:hypothetical protein [Idotea baltica]